MNRRAPHRHVDTKLALDYLDGRLDAAARERVEAHLGEPCAACRERVRSLGALVGVMRSDRTPEVPAFLRERALSVFAPAAAEPAAGVMERLARLLFDSLATPMAAAPRRSVGEARRLRWALGAGTLEAEIEPEGATTRTLRGHFDDDDAVLSTIEARVGDERRTAAFGADGSFVLAGLPAGELRLTVETPAGRWQLPAIEG